MYTIIVICDRSIVRVVKTEKTYLEAIEMANAIMKEYLAEQGITEQSEIDELIKDEELEFMTIEMETAGTTENMILMYSSLSNKLCTHK